MNKKNRSDDQELVSKNLELIISSSNYKLAHEDKKLLNSDEMRGVRMLLEISKPEKFWESKITYQQSSSLAVQIYPIKSQ